jgi:hypothetical protein
LEFIMPSRLALIFCTLLPLVPGAAKPVELFDGKTLTGWTNKEGGAPGAGWQVTEGTLHRKAAGGDLYLAREVGDFDLSFEFKISANGNSGLKYRVAPFGKDLLGVEYQVLDDAGHPDSKVGAHRQTAAFYDIKPASADKPLKPAGEWNAGRIVAKGTKLEHWLNGVKVVEMDTASEEWKTLIAKSKFKNKPGFGQNARGKIFLQDHGNEVWFRNLMLTE